VGVVGVITATAAVAVAVAVGSVINNYSAPVQ